MVCCRSGFVMQSSCRAGLGLLLCLLALGGTWPQEGKGDRDGAYRGELISMDGHVWRVVNIQVVYSSVKSNRKAGTQRWRFRELTSPVCRHRVAS